MKTAKTNSLQGRHIVVVASGWVFLVGGVSDAGDNWKLTDASVIRVWGTTEGLGEIALRGPTPKTILDFCGNPQVPKSQVLVFIPCTYKTA